VRLLLILPVGSRQCQRLKAPQRRIDRAAWEAGDLHDIEAEAVAARNGGSDTGGAADESNRRRPMRSPIGLLPRSPITQSRCFRGDDDDADSEGVTVGRHPGEDERLKLNPPQPEH
jgi:hypothetical protein